MGNLLNATLPDGSSVTYTLDGFGRRVSRAKNGIERRFLYAEGHRLVAVLDASGAVLEQFVYATRRHSPDAMIKGGTAYRILTDQLGSVRLVVNASTGAVAQRIDYDPWGAITVDTAPGFQPLSFASGLYDADTKLVHFGAREYDPEVGRWTTKDPALFQGGLNLYAYAENDPVDWVDPDGRIPLLAVAFISGAVSGTSAFVANALGQSIAGNTINWSHAATAGGIGFVQGALMPASRGSAVGVGAVANVATYLATTPRCAWSADGAGVAAVYGALGGLIGGPAVQGPPVTGGFIPNLAPMAFPSAFKLSLGFSAGVLGANFLGALTAGLPDPQSNNSASPGRH